MQIRLRKNLTRDESLMLLEAANAEIETVRQQLAEAHATIERQNAELDAIGAGGVSSQRITGTDARWYAVGADGQATLCINREDARDTAAEAAQLYPNNAPYTAVQMVPVGAGEVYGSRS